MTDTPPPPQPFTTQGTFTVSGVTFDSSFDSGNLVSVEPTQERNVFVVSNAPDCAGTSHETVSRSWFHFSVTGVQKGTAVTCIMMSVPGCTMFQQDYRPCVMVTPLRNDYYRSPWYFRAIRNGGTEEKAHDQSFDITFSVVFEDDDQTIFVAFSFPYAYTYLMRQLPLWKTKAEAGGIVFDQSTLTTSLDGHNVPLIMITAKDPRGLTTLDDFITHTTRKIALFTSRVHPGETPASHMLHGVLDFLVSPQSDPRALPFCSNFICVIVPMLNPDGVIRGFTRTDTLGENLNRMYANPMAHIHPTIHAVRKLFMTLFKTGRLVCSIDLHAHANKRGVFAYGNAMVIDALSLSMTLPKLLSMNSSHFDFIACNFTEGNMKALGKRGQSKEGAGRVAFFSETQFPYSYTIEANYCVGSCSNPIHVMPFESATSMAIPSPGCSMPRFTVTVFHDVGKAMAVSILDMHSHNTHSRLPYMAIKSVPAVTAVIRRTLMQAVTSARMRVFSPSTRLPEGPLQSNSVLDLAGSKLFPPVSVVDVPIARAAVAMTTSVPHASVSHRLTRASSMTSFPAGMPPPPRLPVLGSALPPRKYSETRRYSVLK